MVAGATVRFRGIPESGVPRRLAGGEPNGHPRPTTVEAGRLRLTAIVPATNSPASLSRCLGSIRAAAEGPDELIVVDTPANRGPASARNAGAVDATGDVLVFVDSDIEVHRDAFSRIRGAFAAQPELTALFGSYDDAPEPGGVVSEFRNLLHHHVHQTSPGRATTFWAGLGAIRSEAFAAAGGFDAERFKKSSVEDIDLGMRLSARGATIELDPALQGKHLKTWTLSEMLRTDFARRGTPWVRVLLQSHSDSKALNLAWRHRLSAVACIVGVAALGTRRAPVAAGAALALLHMNRSFYGLLARQSGPLQASAGVGLHVLHHLAGAASVPAGVAAHLVLRRRAAREAALRSERCASTASPLAPSG